MTDIEQRLLSLLARKGAMVGAASIGHALFPEATMDSHGAAFSVSRFLRAAVDGGLVAKQVDGKRWRYEITQAGREAFAKSKDDAGRQGSFL